MFAFLCQPLDSLVLVRQPGMSDHLPQADSFPGICLEYFLQQIMQLTAYRAHVWCKSKRTEHFARTTAGQFVRIEGIFEVHHEEENHSASPHVHQEGVVAFLAGDLGRHIHRSAAVGFIQDDTCKEISWPVQSHTDLPCLVLYASLLSPKSASRMLYSLDWFFISRIFDNLMSRCAMCSLCMWLTPDSI